MNLTNVQKKALTLFNCVPNVVYSPGDAIYIKNQNVRWDVIIRLKNMGLISGYDLYPYGNFPVYALEITEKGKEEIKCLIIG